MQASNKNVYLITWHHHSVKYINLNFQSDKYSHLVSSGPEVLSNVNRKKSTLVGSKLLSIKNDQPSVDQMSHRLNKCRKVIPYYFEGPQQRAPFINTTTELTHTLFRHPSINSVYLTRGPVNPIQNTSQRCLDYCSCAIHTICRPRFFVT